MRRTIKLWANKFIVSIDDNRGDKSYACVGATSVSVSMSIVDRGTFLFHALLISEQTARLD